MYHVKRIFQSKPGNNLKVATLAYKASEIYQKEGQRGEFSVYFNASTTPGEKGRVVLQWTEDALESPFRGSNKLPSEAVKIYLEILKLTEDTWVEFDELLTEDKMVPV